MAKQKYHDSKHKYFKPSDAEKTWRYAIKKHKTPGESAHFDLRLYNDAYTKVFSWSSKKFLLNGANPVLLRRTPDHPKSSIDFEGTFFSKGSSKLNKVTNLKTGIISFEGVDPKKGIMFRSKELSFDIKPYRGKNYMFMKV